MLRSNDLVAVLGRDVSVRLVNISGSGCLVVTGSRLLEGTTGALRITVDGVEYADDVRVVRCSQVEGSSEYHLGMEFLWTTNPGAYSMRRVIGTLQNAGLPASCKAVEHARYDLAEGSTIGRHSRS